MDLRQTFNIILCWILKLESFNTADTITVSQSSLPNKVKGLSTTCDRNALKISVTTENAFRGAMYAKGYPVECQNRGVGSIHATLDVSPQNCGVKIVKENGRQLYKMILYVQYDPWVQQVADEQLKVTCSLEEFRDIEVTGTTKINVSDDDEHETTKHNSIPRRKKLNENILNFSEFFPTNLLQFPSALQKMVSRHKQNAQTKPLEIVTSANFRRPSNTSFFFSDAPHPVVLTSSGRRTTKQKNIEEGKKKLQVLSSGITIRDSGNSVPYKGIFRASPNLLQKRKENLSWRPVSPNLLITKETSENSYEELGKDDAISCWLDIVKGETLSDESSNDELLVGETATLVIRIHSRPGLDTKVVSCKAHDGSSLNSQDLVDTDGCAVEKEIMPQLRRKRTSAANEEINYAAFKVFKFPDHDSLHIKCHVLVCVGKCEMFNCKRKRQARQTSGFFVIDDGEGRIFSEKMTNPQTSKSSFESSKKTSTKAKIRKSPSRSSTTEQTTTAAQNPKTTTFSQNAKRGEGKVVDIIEVFNSVEVRAPQIDDRPRIVQEYQRDVKKVSEDDSGEELFCLTSTKLLTSFGILLAIFLISLLCAFYWCMKDTKWRRAQKRPVAPRGQTFLQPQPNYFSHSRFPTVVDYKRYPHLATPYHRFPH